MGNCRVNDKNIRMKPGMGLRGTLLPALPLIEPKFCVSSQRLILGSSRFIFVTQVPGPNQGDLRTSEAACEGFKA